jgi:hypothetical protein
MKFEPQEQCFLQFSASDPSSGFQLILQRISRCDCAGLTASPFAFKKPLDWLSEFETILIKFQKRMIPLQFLVNYLWTFS